MFSIFVAGWELKPPFAEDIKRQVASRRKYIRKHYKDNEVLMTIKLEQLTSEAAYVRKALKKSPYGVKNWSKANKTVVDDYNAFVDDYNAFGKLSKNFSNMDEFQDLTKELSTQAAKTIDSIVGANFTATTSTSVIEYQAGDTVTVNGIDYIVDAVTAGHVYYSNPKEPIPSEPIQTAIQLVPDTKGRKFKE